MAAIGESVFRVVILPRVLLAADAYAEQKETWPDPPSPVVEWWAAREKPQTGEALADALRRTTETVRLVMNGKPPLTQYDRLRVKSTGVVFAVDGMPTYDPLEGETTVTAVRVIP